MTKKILSAVLIASSVLGFNVDANAAAGLKECKNYCGNDIPCIKECRNYNTAKDYADHVVNCENIKAEISSSCVGIAAVSVECSELAEESYQCN